MSNPLRILRIAGLRTILHNIPKPHAFPPRAVEDRERGPSGVGAEIGQSWNHG